MLWKMFLNLVEQVLPSLVFTFQLLFNNNIRQNKSFNMVGETWDFDVTRETSDSQSTCCRSNSENSIVESRDVNTVNT